METPGPHIRATGEDITPKEQGFKEGHMIGLLTMLGATVFLALGWVGFIPAVLVFLLGVILLD